MVLLVKKVDKLLASLVLYDGKAGLDDPVLFTRRTELPIL
jgi:hypothetical protein